MDPFLNKVLFSGETWSVSLGQVLGSLFILALVIGGVLLVNKIFRQEFLSRLLIRRKKERQRFFWSVLLLVLGVVGAARLLGIPVLSELETPFWNWKMFQLSVFDLFLGVAIVFLADLFLSLVNYSIQVLIRKGKLTSEKGRSLNRMFKLVGYVLAGFFLLALLGLPIRKILVFPILTWKKTVVSVSHLLILVFLFMFTHWGLFIGEFVFKKQVDRKRIEASKGHSLFQIIQYVVWVLFFIIALDSVGIELTVIVASSAALFVGIGFGLQYIFKDILSGLFLLFEQKVKIGDIVELQGVVGKVEEIGIRTSIIITRDNITMIVPNHYFIEDQVINWSLKDTQTRFNLDVGVAYGSDVRLVEKLLLDCARKNERVCGTPRPLVKFENFGDSSLEFKLLFYTYDSFNVEFIRSELRFAIDQAFRDNNVTIPFPQRDVHIMR